jgi:AP endonuclease-1
MSSNSSLSTPPKDLQPPITADETKPAVTKAVNGKKRKADTAVDTTKVIKRKATVQAETDASVNGSADKPVEAAKPKKRAAKAKVKEETVKNEVVVQEGEKGTVQAKEKIMR